MKELESRLLKLEEQLKLLQRRAQRVHGTSRVRMARLERRARNLVARVHTALPTSRGRIIDAVETGR